MVVSELSTLPTGFFTANCPAPPYFVEFTYLAHSSVTRLASTGDLYYTLLDQGYACVDPAAGRFIFRADVRIVGGTGRFAAATGSGTALGAGTLLLLDANGLVAFGSLDGDTTLQIIVPGGN
jgi:hypothetical protein